MLERILAWFGYYRTDPNCPANLQAAALGAKIVSEKNAELQNALKKAEDANSALGKTGDEKDAAILKLTEENKLLAADLASVRTDLTLARMEAVEPQDPTPEFLDPSQDPYLPFFQFFGPTGQMDGTQGKDPRDMFIPTWRQRGQAGKSGYERMSRYDALLWGWKTSIGFSYKADFGDNHQLPVQTEARLAGDCEDSSYRIVAFWRLMKIRPASAFMATGNSPFGYHAWPIAYLSADDIKGTPVEKFGAGWYIYEGTLTYQPDAPRPLKGSGYKVVDGLSNWQMKGKVRPAYGAPFELVAGAPGGFVENSDEKLRKINEDWRAWHASLKT